VETSRFTNASHGAAIAVKVTTRARKSEVAGILVDGTVKIRIAAPPARGAANTALIEFLAKLLGIAASQVDIIAGETSQRKLVALVGISPDKVDSVFQKLIAAPRRAGAGRKRTAR
jgi:uncharacterized protein (TIGR00251 family)